MQAFVSVNWLLAEEHIDLETELAWGFLDYLMLGTTASPLRRALTESGLGESIIGGGLSDELRQPTFSLGLKGVDPANAQKVCSLCLCCFVLSLPQNLPRGCCCVALVCNRGDNSGM